MLSLIPYRILIIIAHVHAQQHLFPVLNFNIFGGRNMEFDPAEYRLRRCCSHLHHSDSYCKTNFCSFEALNSNNIILFMATCASRGPTVGQMWDCVSSRQNHQSCCHAYGVSPSCMIYCEATNGVPTEPSKYLQCLQYFNPIRNCFKRYLTYNPNMFGDF